MTKDKKLEHALIMAAGRGIRMMPLTKKIPKAMAPIKGSTLISKVIKKLSNKFLNIHVTVGYKGALLAKHVTELNVASIFNTKNKGNSWWIFNTLLKNLNEPIFVLTCDNFYKINFQEQLNQYNLLKKPACMIVPVKPVNGLEGDYIFNKGNFIYRISRKVKSDYYCSGIQIINPFKINKLIKSEEQFYRVWKNLIKINQLKISNVVLNDWYAIDNLEQLKKINE